MKTCLRQKCQKEFEPTKPKQKFCSAKCKTYYSREEKKDKLKFASPNPIEKKIDAIFEKLDNIVFSPVTEASYDGSRLPKGYVADEPLSFDRLKAQIQPQTKNEDYYAAQLHQAQDLEQLEAVGRKIKASGLLWKEKQNLQILGQQIAKAKFID
jgi:hypothetical protein